MSKSNGELIMEALTAAIKQEINEVFEEEKQRVLERLEQAKEDMVAKAGLRISEMMSVQDMGRRVVITIEKVSK